MRKDPFTSPELNAGTEMHVAFSYLAAHSSRCQSVTHKLMFMCLWYVISNYCALGREAKIMLCNRRYLLCIQNMHTIPKTTPQGLLSTVPTPIMQLIQSNYFFLFWFILCFATLSGTAPHLFVVPHIKLTTEY